LKGLAKLRCDSFIIIIIIIIIILSFLLVINQDKIPLPLMQSIADKVSLLESDHKRAHFRNLVQLIRLTTTILNKEKGPKLQSEEKVTSAYASSPYTILYATVQLLVRKDEVIAAAEVMIQTLSSQSWLNVEM
jgi:hypothetical protein